LLIDHSAIQVFRACRIGCDEALQGSAKADLLHFLIATLPKARISPGGDIYNYSRSIIDMPYILFKRKRVEEAEIAECKMSPSIKIFLDGRPNRIYFPGEKVSGKVVLTTRVQEEIKYIKVRFLGTSFTTMTRVLPGTAEDSEADNTKTWSESKPLFGYDRALVTKPFTLAANQYSWDFEFKFPSEADREYQTAVGRHFTKDPHKLPPSFDSITEGRGGGSVSYTIDVKIARSGINRTDVKVSEILRFQREPIAYLPPRILPRFIPVQASRVKRSTGNSEPSSPNFVTSLGQKLDWRGPVARFSPMIYSPEAISPGQKIPIALSVRPIQRKATDVKIDGLVMTGLQIDLTTHTAIVCGGLLSRPQDTISQSVLCINRQNCNVPIPVDQTRVPIVSDFRLVDNNQALPTFKSYIISRFYVMTIRIALRWKSTTWNITSHSELEVLPKCAPGQLEDVETLPPYTSEHDNIPTYEEFLSQESERSSESSTGTDDEMDAYNAPVPRLLTTSTNHTQQSSGPSLALPESYGDDSDDDAMHMRPRMPMRVSR
jgi:hypothetical protein